MISDVTSEEEEEDRAPTPNNSINKNMNIKVYKNMAQWACKKKKKKKKKLQQQFVILLSILNFTL